MAHECRKCSYMGEEVYRYCDECRMQAIERPAFAREITRLRADLKKSKQDTVRLDWLERRTIIAGGAGIQWEDLSGLVVHEWHGEEPLREAIDITRGGEEG